MKSLTFLLVSSLIWCVASGQDMLADKTLTEAAAGGLRYLTPRAFAQMLALQNAEAQYSKLNIQVNDELRRAESGLYETVAYGSIRQEGRNRPRTVAELVANGSISILDETVNTREIGVKNRLPSGGDISLAYRLEDRKNNLISTLSQGTKQNEYNGSVNLNLKQPLLKGFGRQTTETDKQVAELEYRIAQQQYRQQLLKVTNDGLGLYWQLYRAQQTLSLRQDSLVYGQRLLKDTEARVAAGKAPASAILEIKSNLLNREIEVGRSIQALADAKSKFMTTLAIDDKDGISVDLSPQFVSTGDADIKRTAVEKVLQDSLASWPPYQISEFRKQQGLLRLAFAKNQMSPSLDLTVGASGTGLAYSRKDAINLAMGSNYPEWFVGLNFEVFTSGNIKASSQFKAQVARVTQSEIDLAAIQTSLNNELNSRFQEVDSSHSAARMAQTDLELRSQIFDIEKQRFALGFGLLGALIQRENDLIEARLKLLENQIRLELAAVGLRQLRGTLLDSLGINLTQ